MSQQPRPSRLSPLHRARIAIAHALVISAAAIALASGAGAAESAAPGDSWRPGEPTVAYAEWAFTEVPRGTLWVPPLVLWQPRTALIPSPSGDLLSAADRDALAQAKTLQQAQRLPEAVALLEQADANAASAEVALALANLLLSKAAGEHRDEAAAMRWLQRAAERDPQFYRHLGEYQYAGKFGLGADPVMAAHWWSLGLSRGCQQCADELLRVHPGADGRQGVELDGEQALAIAMFGADIGSRAAFRRVAREVRWASESKRGDGPAAALAWQLGQRARALAGTENPLMGGLMIALQERYRTGLVQRSTLKVLAHLQAGQPLEAVDALSGWNGAGRYTGYLLDEALSLAPAAGQRPLGPSGRAWAAQEALLHGRFDHGLSVAMSYAHERSVLVLQPDGKLRSEGQKADYKLARQAYGLAAASGLVPAEALQAVRTEIAYAETRACWFERYISAKVAYGVMPLTSEQAQRVIGGGLRCSTLERAAQQLSGNPNLMKHPPEHHAAVALLRQIDTTREARVAEQAQRAAASYGGASTGIAPRGYAGRVGSFSAHPMLSSAEASRRAAANVCAWSMNNSRFCK